MPLSILRERETPTAELSQPSRRDLRLVASVVAGGALAATAAPWEQRWLLPVAVAILVLALRGGGVRSGVILGYVFGATYVLTLTFWMRAVGVDAWLLVGLAAAGFYALLGGGVAIVRGLPAWPVWVACLWTAVENVMASWPLGGFPWTRLVWATADTPLAQWLPWLGATGVSFLAALTGALLAWIVSSARRQPRRAGVVATVAAAVLATPSVVVPASLDPRWTEDAPSVRVAIVQGGVPGAGNDVVAVHREVTANHVAATTELAEQVERGSLERPDFVLWPENSTAVDPFRDQPTRAAISSAVAAIDVPVVVGAIVDGKRADEVLNQGIVWTPDGGSEERYTKRHPVPFGEYLPWRAWLTGLSIGRLDMVPRDMVAGRSSDPLDVGGIAVANLICFDVGFDDAIVEQIRRGAQMVTVQTSNAMFIDTAQPAQQFTITRLRAMESGRSIAVASVNGISAEIGPDGNVNGALAPRATGFVVAEVPLLERQTPAVRLSSAIKALTSLAAAGAFGVGAVLRRSRIRRPNERHAAPTPELRTATIYDRT